MEYWVLFAGKSLAKWGILNTLIGITLRLLRPGDKVSRLADLFLIVGMFICAWHAFMYYLIVTGYVQDYPLLYNKGLPFYYLIAPCFYFFVRTRLFTKPIVWRKMWPHLIPFLVCFFDTTIPFALLSYDEQYSFVELVVSNMFTGVDKTFGFIPQMWHYILRFLLAVLYLLAQWKLWYSYDDHNDATYRAVGRKIKYFCLVYSVYLALQSSLVLSVSLNLKQGTFILKNPDKLVWISLLFMLFSFYFLISSIFVVKKRRAEKSPVH